MKLKYAKIKTFKGDMTPNGPEKIMVLKSGRRGTGREIGRVVYWPWSSASADNADKIIFEIAEREGVEVVQDFE